MVNETDLVEAVKLAIEDIDETIRGGHRWRNPIDDSNKICEDCPYKLEHIVLCNE